MDREEAEIVIVGSGATGSALAAKLSAGGKRVVVLEAGPSRTNDWLVSSNIWARRLKWGGEPVLEAGENPVGYVFNAGYGVGGSAMHHYAVWPRMHEADFECRSRYDLGLDWPIAYEDLRPFYDEVQQNAGIAGDAGKEKWRPAGAPYPMPPVPVFAQGRIIARGFEKLGFSTAPLPLAVTTTRYRGRETCIWDGWCDAGCPIGALANPMTVYLPPAIEAGVELKTEATVTQVLTDRRGERVTGVEYRSADGHRRELMADMVVLAAFSVQNSRILLNSRSDRHPRGLANSSGLLGRYVMSHPAALIYGLFDEETECHLGATGGQLLCQDGYDKVTHREAGAFGSYQWMIAQATKPNDLLGYATTRPDLFGDDLRAFMRRASRHFATMTAVIEDLPVAENVIRLSDRHDRFGVPLAHVTHTTHPGSKALWQAALVEGKAIFEAAGATQTWTGPQAAQHIMGGTIMGRDPASSVTNQWGLTHDLPNLAVAGPGLFPTSGGVNPTFTALALAERTGHYVLENWGSVKA